MKLSPTGLGVVTIAVLSLVALSPHSAADARALVAADFGASLASLAALLLVALGAWIIACVVLTLLANHAALTFGLSRAITPRFLRRALFLGAAGALAVGPVSATSTTGQGPDGQDSTSFSRVLDGLHLPDRPVSAAPRHTPGPRIDKPRTYVVRPGDALWSIAARDLDPTTSATVIAAQMRRWYVTNRAAIGPDPNLIFPGQHLNRPVKSLPSKEAP